MELSWIDELVSAERVLPNWLITEIKAHLHTNGDELMVKMVAYKSACMEQRLDASTSNLLREILVLTRGEEKVRQGEIADAQKWKVFDEIYQREFKAWILER